MNSTKKLILPGTVVVAALLGVAGSAALTSLQANAATSSTTAATPSTQTVPTDAPKDPAVDGHVGSNGTKEVLLTGDTADKVKAAALAEVPGGTVQRVENDAEGSPYEAHMTKSDGSQVTVKVGADFKATGIETGGPGGPKSTSSD